MRTLKPLLATALLIGSLVTISACGPDGKPVSTPSSNATAQKPKVGNDTLAPNPCALLTRAEILRFLSVQTNADKAAASNPSVVQHADKGFNTRQCTLTMDGQDPKSLDSGSIVVTVSQYDNPAHARGDYLVAANFADKMPPKNANIAGTAIADEATVFLLQPSGQGKVLVLKDKYVLDVMVNNIAFTVGDWYDTMTNLGRAAAARVG